MADDSNWAGRGFSQPGPVTARDAAARNEGLAAAAAEGELRRRQAGNCPLHMWNGPGHSEPFRGCPGDREPEAGS